MSVVDIYKTKRRYATILADPPWAYGQNLGNGTRRGSKNQGAFRDYQGVPYARMSIDDLCQLPVRRVAAKDCLLWLWTVNPFIPEALKIVEQWGFSYLSMRTWVKYPPGSGAGVGKWWWGATEQLILARRGHVSPPKKGPKYNSVFFVPPKGHSKKPRQSYVDIELISPEPRLELFARRAREGWDSWGLEAKEIDRELERDVEAYL